MQVKRNIFITLITALLFTAFTTNAQLIVRDKPQLPQYTRPHQPTPKHVWIDEEWQEKGNQYVFIGGRWYLPPHPDYIYVFGHWKHHPNGWEWIAGYWQKQEDKGK